MDAQLSRLKEHHEYERWRGQTRLEESLLVWRYFLIGDELVGLELIRSQAIKSPEWPPSIQSIWRTPAKDGRTLVRLDLFECDSTDAAHELIIRFLGEFQGPVVIRESETRVGDVAFTGPENTAMVFARGNMVVGLRNAGSETVPVQQFAVALDEDLTSRPEAGGTVVPEIRRFEPLEQQYRADTGGPLALEASDPLNRPLRFKFYSSGAELVLEEGTPVLRPISPGSGRVTLIAENENRGIASLTLDLASRG
jgi:hypothetical protein